MIEDLAIIKWILPDFSKVVSMIIEVLSNPSSRIQDNKKFLTKKEVDPEKHLIDYLMITN